MRERLEKILTYAEHLDFIGSWAVKLLITVSSATLAAHYWDEFIKLSSSLKFSLWLLLSAVLYILLSFLWIVIRGTRLKIICEESLGREAHLTILNKGVAADFSATAAVLHVDETPPNNRGHKTFHVGWLDSPTSTMHIPHNGTGILVLAKANSVVLGADRFNEMNIWEHRAQGSESLEYFRWQSVDDVPPKVVLKISVVRAAPPSKAHMEDFIIAGGIHGGIQIKSLSSR